MFTKFLQYTTITYITSGLIVAALVITGSPSFDMDGVSVWNYVVVVVSLTAIGLFLTLTGFSDERAQSLGSLFLIVASTYALRLVNFSQGAPEWVDTLGSVLSRIPIDAFMPYLIWRFFSDFPRASTTRFVRNIEVAATNVALVAGAVLFLFHFIPSEITTDWMKALDRDNRDGAYWGVIYALILLALPLPFIKARTAPDEEAKRFRVFTWSFAACVTPPLCYFVIAILKTDLHESMVEDGIYPVISSTIQFLIVTLAAVTAYSVKVDRILDSRALLRRYIGHSLIRQLIPLIYLVPITFAGLYLYARRAEDLNSIFSGIGFVWISTCLAVAFLGFTNRERIRTRLDAFYLHANSDIESAVRLLADKTRGVTELDLIANVLCEVVSDNLRVQSVRVLLPGDQQDREFYDFVSNLEIQDRLRDSEYGFIDLEDQTIVWPKEVQETVFKNRYAAIAAFLDPDKDNYTGYLALGPMHSEAPFSLENAKFLSAIGASASLIVNRVLTRTDDQQECARQCENCGSVFDRSLDECIQCGSDEKVDAALPLVLRNKYKILNLQGTGAMGMVYRAVDLDLDRLVAVKTLPPLRESESEQILSEARSMARVHHPNITTIFSVETWKESPYIVEEFHPGGTLAESIKASSISIDRCVTICLLMAEALGKLHSSGIVHGDVKPANIGLSDDKTPKLMDFGVSWLTDKSDSSSEFFDGTMIYASPERLSQGITSPEVDVWALSVVLFECLTGRHPFGNSTEAYSRILGCRTIELDWNYYGLPERLTRFLLSCLAKDRSKRPQTAESFYEQLERSYASR